MNTELKALRRQAEWLQDQGQHDAAIAAYRRLLARWPALPDDWFNLAWLLRRLGRAEDALKAYGQALAHGIGGAEEVHLERAIVYSELLRRDAEAEAELKQALTLAPGFAPALLNLGNLHEEYGRREAAIECYERLLALIPSSATAPQAQWRLQALARLAHLRPPLSSEDPLLLALEQAAGAFGVPPDVRATALFAQGRALDALQLPERAFAAFAVANAAASQGARAYDPAAAERLTAELKAAFATAVTVSRPGPDLTAQTRPPLFICGMFRSGSTLLEQALAAHPQIEAGGEIEFLPRLVASTLAPFPQSLQTLSASCLADYASQYLAHLRQQFPDALQAGRLLTDKRPDNFRLIGLIKHLFPDARFVHTVRDPRDVGLSIWMHHLDPRQLPHACDLAAIGHHYGQYVQLMNHWQALYPDSILAFDYDRFVGAPRATLEPVLEWLGLAWHDDCLEFHRRQQSVRTASYWQVRRPLYGEASGRFRRYGTLLDPLLRSLRQAGVMLPDDGISP